jgi:hypothetical protein
MATWQAAEPGSVAQDDAGNYHIRVAGQWQPAPKNSLLSDEHGAFHFDSEAIQAQKPPATPKAGAAGAGASSGTASTSSGNPIMDTINDIVAAGKGVTQAATQGALSIPHLAAHGLYGLLTGGKTDPSIISSGILGPPTMGPEGQALMQKLHALAAGATSGLPAANPAQAPGVNSLNAPSDNPLVANAERVVGNVSDILPAAGLAKAGLGGIKALGELGSGAATAEVPPLGMVTGETNPIARPIAGASGRPAAMAHNQAAADLHLPAQVGVMPGAKLGVPGPDGRLPLDVAKDAPNAVYQRVENALPTTELHPNAAQMVNNIGTNDMVVHSPDTQSLIDAQKQRLLAGPLSGKEVVDGQRALRFNGFKNKGSLDPENQALGDAQLKMADALHQHMVDTLPPNADVSVEQLVNARKTLAQIHTLDEARIGNNLNMHTLAKFGRDNPGVMDGPMADVAGFADRNPHVTGLPGAEERFNPSGVGKDVAAVDIKNPQSWIQPFFGARARAAITNRPAAPVAGLAADLNPIDRTPQPPPGMTAGPMGAPPAAAGPPGQIPQADVLAHGVEQPLPDALTSGPMGAPAPSGMPFAIPPDSVGAIHKIVKGRPGQQPPAPASRFVNDQEIPTQPEPAPVSPLGSRFGVQPDQPPLADHAGVISQGVPEGIVQPSGPNPRQPSPPNVPPAEGSRPVGPATSAGALDPEAHNQGVMQNVTSMVDRLHAKMRATDIVNPQAPGALHKILQHMATNLDPGTSDGAFFKDLSGRLASVNLTTSLRLPGNDTLGSAFGKTVLHNSGGTHAEFNDLSQDPAITILHEATHAATMEQLSKNPHLQYELSNVMAAAQDAPAVKALSEQDKYGVTARQKNGDLNPHEIVAEATANPRLQQALRDTPSRTTPGQSLYDDYKKAIGTALKFPPTAYNDPRFEKILNGYGSGSNA